MGGRVFVAIMLAGCGRIAFDATATPPDTGTGQDAMPGARLELPPGDVTGDAFPDLLVYSNGASLGVPGALWVFGGASTFAAASTNDRVAVIVGTSACAIRDTLRLVDLDRDGSSEILVGADCSGQRRVAVVSKPVGMVAVDAYPMFAVPGAVRLDGFGEPGMQSALWGSGDFDGDGKADLVGLYHWMSTIHVYPSFETAATPLVPATTITGAPSEALGSPAEAIGADLDGDGNDDLVVSAHHDDVPLFDSGAVHVILGPFPPGSHDVDTLAGPIFTGDRAGAEYGRVGVLDANLDGTLDLAIASPNDGRIAIFFGPLARSGIRTVANADVRVDGVAGTRWGEWLDSHADFDGDGNLDLVWLGNNVVGGLISRAGLTGTITPDVLIDTSGSTLTDMSSVGDLDGNGSHEIVVGTSSSRAYVLSGAARNGTLAAGSIAVIQGMSAEAFGSKVVQR